MWGTFKGSAVMVGTTKRGLLVAVISVVALAAVACDAVAPPLTIVNSTSDTISVSFFYKESSRTLRIKERDDGQFSESLSIASGEGPITDFAVFERDQYTLIVSNSDTNELFRRTFLEEELDDRDWKIIITPEGIK